MTINKETLYYFSLLTLFGFSLLGLTVAYFWVEQPLNELILGGAPLMWQLILGFVVGILMAGAVLLIVNLTPLKTVSEYFNTMLDTLELDLEDVIFYSFCAGVGEEVFFRAAMQTLLESALSSPHIAIFITSVIFIALHGYIRAGNLKFVLFAFLLIGVSSSLGYLFLYFGLIAAIAAHFSFDLVMFCYLIHQQKNAPPVISEEREAENE